MSSSLFYIKEQQTMDSSTRASTTTKIATNKSVAPQVIQIRGEDLLTERNRRKHSGNKVIVPSAPIVNSVQSRNSSIDDGTPTKKLSSPSWHQITSNKTSKLESEKGVRFHRSSSLPNAMNRPAGRSSSLPIAINRPADQVRIRTNSSKLGRPSLLNPSSETNTDNESEETDSCDGDYDLKRPQSLPNISGQEITRRRRKSSEFFSVNKEYKKGSQSPSLEIICDE